jgi:hypothetical protein
MAQVLPSSRLLSSICNNKPNAKLAYFYFSFTDTNKQKVSNFLRSILGQFVYQKAITPNSLKDLYKTYKHSTPPTKLLLSVLDTILQLPGENFLIVDALDECPAPAGENGRDGLCEHLRYLSNLKRLHLLATSRQEGNLVDGLVGSEGLLILPIRNAQIDADIRLYVQSQLETNLQFRSMKWLAKVKEEILKTLEEGAQGM